MYDLRHGYATLSIQNAQVPSLWHLGKLMGTSADELERTYLHWLPSDDDAIREAFDRWDDEAFGDGAGTDKGRNRRNKPIS
jgi:hypothetical protein